MKPCYLNNILICLWLLPTVGYAANINIKSIHTYTQDNTYFIDADFSIDLSDEAIDALQHGISLDIHTTIEITRKRKWLWDKVIYTMSISNQLQYQPLTDNYLLIDMHTGTQKAYNSLNKALHHLNQLRNLALSSTNLISQHESLNGRIKRYLNIESLPTPIRPIAYLSANWKLASEWYEWRI